MRLALVIFNIDVPYYGQQTASKQGIRWPVSHGHIAGSGAQPFEVTYFLKLTAHPEMSFYILLCQSELKCLTDPH